MTLPTIALLVQVTAAAVLLLTGAQKLAEPSAIRETVARLEPPVSAERIVYALAAAELATGGALVLAPTSLATAVAVAMLGVGFAGAGLWARVRGLDVECACFGSAVAGRLGLRQVALAPLWLAVAAVGPLAGGQRPQVLVLLTIALSAGALIRVAPLLTEHRLLRHLMEGR